MSAGKITYGSLTGHYFLQGAIDNFVLPLAEEIQRRFPEVDIQIYYDASADFYHCEFVANGKRFDVRYYKVFSVSIDGKDGWVGCPRGQMHSFVDAIVRDAAK